MPTYYISPLGSNIAPYDNWAKAAWLPQTVAALNPAGGLHNIYIAPGNYASNLLFSHANWAGSSILGTAAHGSTAPAAKDQVIITAPAGSHGLFVGQPNITCNYFTLAGTDATHDTFYLGAAGTGFVGRNLVCRNSGRYLMYLMGTNYDIKYFLAEGCDGPFGINIESGGAGKLVYGIVRNSTTKFLSAGNGIRSNSSGNNTFDNLIVMGSRISTIAQAGSGTMDFVNCMLYSGTNTGSYIGYRSAGVLNIDHSYLVYNAWTPINLFFGTVGDTNNVKTAAPTFVRRQRSGFVVPVVDDATNAAYAYSVAGLLKARNLKGTFFPELHGLESPSYLTSTRSIIADYPDTMEIGCHAYSHSDLSLTGTVFSITKAGATINIDRTANSITVSGAGGGTVSNFKTMKLDDIKTALVALGCTCGAYQTNQFGFAYGEIIADSGGPQASPYNATYLIDVTCASGLFKSEIADAKAAMESLLGITLTSFACPYDNSNANVNAAVLAAGFTSCRNDGSGYSWLLENLDLGAIGCTASIVNQPDDATVRAYFRSICEAVANYGSLFSVLAHNASQLSLARWELILDDVLRYSEITCTSMGDAVNTIKTSGTWSTSDNRIYTRTWTDLSDYHQLSTSPCLGAGAIVSGETQDYFGNAVPAPGRSTPCIGIHERGLIPKGSLVGPSCLVG